MEKRKKIYENKNEKEETGKKEKTVLYHVIQL